MNSPNKKSPYIIVVGNEKGGAGKTTTTIHLITYLLNLGFGVASFDLDYRQKTLSRYLENRKKYSIKNNISLKLPKHFILNESLALNIRIKEEEEKNNFEESLQEIKNDVDFIIFDTPGSNTYLSRIAHSYADSIITPVNDSFLDLDVLAHFDADNFEVLRPSIYSELIWKQKIERAKREQNEINWLVIRNRVSHIDAINKRNVALALQKLSNKVGFKVVEGFSERVIFRELFLHGLTLLDIGKEDFGIKVTLSHIAAKQELRNFLSSLNLREVIDAIKLAELETS